MVLLQCPRRGRATPRAPSCGSRDRRNRTQTAAAVLGDGLAAEHQHQMLAPGILDRPHRPSDRALGEIDAADLRPASRRQRRDLDVDNVVHGGLLLGSDCVVPALARPGAPRSRNGSGLDDDVIVLDAHRKGFRHVGSFHQFGYPGFTATGYCRTRMRLGSHHDLPVRMSNSQPCQGHFTISPGRE